jgi:hypothetical protein
MGDGFVLVEHVPHQLQPSSGTNLAGLIARR